MSGDAHCDPEALVRLEGLIGVEAVREVLGVFLDDVPRRMETVREGERAGNLSLSAAALHEIKGSAGMLGAVRLEKIAGRMEQIAKRDDRGAFTGLLDELESALAGTREFLRERKEALER